MFTITWLNIISTATLVLGLLEELSGVLVCVNYVQKRSTGDSSALSFIIGFLSHGIWLLYGCLTNARTIIALSFVGVLLFLSYTNIFLNYTPYRSISWKQFLIAILIAVVTLLYVQYDPNSERNKHVIGVLGNIVIVMFSAAPFTMVFHVIKSKSTDVLPLPLILTTFGVSFTVLVYACLIEDIYLQVPEILGASLSLLQLSLFLIYPTRSEPLLKIPEQPVVFVISDRIPYTQL